MSTIIEGHTIQRYDGELNELHLSLIKMGGLVLDQTKLALEAWKPGNVDAAKTVIERENDVDKYEMNLDEKIIEVIALRSPKAKDLRIVMAFSKAVTDLERMGDLTKRVSKIALAFHQSEDDGPSSKMTQDIFAIGKMAVDILQRAIAVMDTFDQEEARALVCLGHSLDEEFAAAMGRLTSYVIEDSHNINYATNIVLALKALERIGDHAQNLAEQSIFVVTGVDIRHQDPAFCMPKSPESN